MIKVKVKPAAVVGVRLSKPNPVRICVKSTIVEYIPQNLGRIAYDGATLAVY